MKGGTTRIACLVAGSGLCALVYQVAWLRELRLVFGGSTAASAAVLAIFMGGLGVGSARLGRRADLHVSPLRLYSNLELGIALSAAATPFLLALVREVYISLGGTMGLGIQGATFARLGLSALVLGVPTFLMGGTLPAVARAVESKSDVGRRQLALLYGANTLGAVTGAFVATFYLFEWFGTRSTLWLACAVNVLVAVAARSLSRRVVVEDQTEIPTAEPSAPVTESRAPAVYILAAASIVGFAFLLMELVWYRMLSPLLGGSTYTFGLILAVALLGIGVGSLWYSRASTRRPTLEGFALTAALEALFMALPFALGDRLAVLTEVLRDLAAFGFFGHVVGWSVITAIVVLPAAIVAGYQFPMLIALLGSGRERVGQHTGYAYACNTGGAIAGSLAGGFGLIPLLGAVTAWKCVVLLLAILAASALVLGRRSGSRLPRSSFSFGALALAIVLVGVSTGPTAVWRHSSIGAGRSVLGTNNRNELTKAMYDLRRQIVWDRDGVESSVGLQVVSGVAFLLNGKNDGNARFDASTQVSLGLLSALFHGRPEDAFVIGMGTGSTAGWLGAVDSIERIDVAELEPAIMEIVRRSATVNHDAMNDPKINVIAGDARELLLTAPRAYDLVVSEPSNPYRAGIASLYTVEFYEAVKARLKPGGIFSQWVQAYEIDTQTFRTIYATLSSVFEFVESWQTNDLDLLLVCADKPIVYDEVLLRERMEEEPYASAFRNAWGVTDLEGLFSRYVANASLPKQVELQEAGRLNTDDRTLVEFGFARTVGQDLTFSANELRNAAYQFGALRPLTLVGELDWSMVEEQRFHMSTLMDVKRPDEESYPAEQRARLAAMAGYIDGDLAKVLREWNKQPRAPHYYLELAMLSEALAEAADPAYAEYAEKLSVHGPVEALAARARYLARSGAIQDATAALASVFEHMREDPWPLHLVMQRTIGLAQEIASAHPETAPALLAAIDAPFAVDMHEEIRKEMTVDIASRISIEAAVPYVEAFEPHVLWTRDFLSFRAQVYEATGHARAKLARKQLAQFLRNEPKGFREIMEAKSPAPHYAAEQAGIELKEQMGEHAHAGPLGKE